MNPIPYIYNYLWPTPLTEQEIRAQEMRAASQAAREARARSLQESLRADQIRDAARMKQNAAHAAALRNVQFVVGPPGREQIFRAMS